MRNLVLIALLAAFFLSRAIALAAGPVTTTPIGTGSPPPTGPETGVPHNPKPAPGTPGTSTGNSAVTADEPSSPAAAGIDTSTAAPGGQAESSKNGALSTPVDGDSQKPKHHRKREPASGGEAPK